MYRPQRHQFLQHHQHPCHYQSLSLPPSICVVHQGVLIACFYFVNYSVHVSRAYREPCIITHVVSGMRISLGPDCWYAGRVTIRVRVRVGVWVRVVGGVNQVLSHFCCACFLSVFERYHFIRDLLYVIEIEIEIKKGPWSGFVLHN